jgi:hypothetical protein
MMNSTILPRRHWVPVLMLVGFFERPLTILLNPSLLRLLMLLPPWIRSISRMATLHSALCSCRGTIFMCTTFISDLLLCILLLLLLLPLVPIALLLPIACVPVLHDDL